MEIDGHFGLRGSQLYTVWQIESEGEVELDALHDIVPDELGVKPA